MIMDLVNFQIFPRDIYRQIPTKIGYLNYMIKSEDKKEHVSMTDFMFQYLSPLGSLFILTL